MKDRRKCRIDEIEAITLVVHPDVYSVIHKANLVKMISGDARATQQTLLALAPIAEHKPPEEGDFVYDDYLRRLAEEDFLASDSETSPNEETND
jgi:hypothetical protein